MRILLVEDDPDQSQHVVQGLRQQGYAVEHAGTGRDGLFMAVSEHFDLLIIDRMLPHMDGLALITALRATGKRTPVIILSALGQIDDRVQGLKAGGDDYIVKPFSFVELYARIEAVTRRSTTSVESNVLRVADLELDRMAHSARRDGKLIDLKPQEYRLLEYLLRHAGQVVTRTMLFEGVWDYHFDPQTNVIDVHISRLRAKVDPPGSMPLIQTVRGAGYCLRDSLAA